MFYDLTQLQNRVILGWHTLYTVPYMALYTYVTDVYRITTVCTLYQYRTLSVCYDSLNYIYKNDNKHTFRSLSRVLSRSCACLILSYLQHHESSICEHNRQCIECGGSEDQQVRSQCRGCDGGSLCEHKRQRNFKVAIRMHPQSHSSVRQSHGDGGCNVPYQGLNMSNNCG